MLWTFCFSFIGWWDASFRQAEVTSGELLFQLSMFKLLWAKPIRSCHKFILLSPKKLPWCHIRINLLQVQREFCECFPRRILCLQTIIACMIIFTYNMTFKYLPIYLFFYACIMLGFILVRMYQRLVRIWRKLLDLFSEIVMSVWI
jgi:hypothetical protein